MGLARMEQETHISFGRDDGRAVVYTSDTTVITKLDRLAGIPGAEWRKEREVCQQGAGEPVAATYSCPVALISFRTRRLSRKCAGKNKEGFPAGTGGAAKTDSAARNRAAVCNYGG